MLEPLLEEAEWVSAVLALSDALSNGRRLLGALRGEHGEASPPGWLSTCVHVKRRGGLGPGAVICVLVPGLADIRDRLGGKGMDSGPDRLGRDSSASQCYIPSFQLRGSPKNWKDE